MKTILLFAVAFAAVACGTPAPPAKPVRMFEAVSFSGAAMGNERIRFADGGTLRFSVKGTLSAWLPHGAFKTGTFDADVTYSVAADDGRRFEGVQHFPRVALLVSGRFAGSVAANDATASVSGYFDTGGDKPVMGISDLWIPLPSADAGQSGHALELGSAGLTP